MIPLHKRVSRAIRAFLASAVGKRVVEAASDGKITEAELWEIATEVARQRGITVTP